MTPRVVIVGAGLAGLTAAHRLLSRASAPDVTVIDKGRRGGGRLCTRTVSLPDRRKAIFDLGPPILYTRLPGVRDKPSALAVNLANELPGDPLFARRVVGRVGAAGESAHGEVTGFTATGGMRELAFRLLAAHGDRLDFRDHTLAEKLERTDDGWRVHTRSLRDGHETTVTANGLILTPPVPQALELLASNNLTLPDDIRDSLRSVSYARCVALYGLFADGDDLAPGCVWLGDGPIEWISDNHRKGVSAVGPAITALTTDDWATEHWDEPDEQLIQQLLLRLRPWVGEPIRPECVWVHKWRWARPLARLRSPCAVLRDLSTVVAGDGFASIHPDPVDAAVASGTAAAERVGALLTALARRDDRYTLARPRHYTLEVAVTTPAEAVSAAIAGADRLELSSGLALGGLTPSISLFRAVREAFPGKPLYVLLRPRPGGFAYSSEECDVMTADAEAFLREGADGIVFAALTPTGDINYPACRALVELAEGKAVFHRAFDFLPNPFVALDHLIELGFERVLTSGGGSTAEAGTTRLAALVQHAGWQLGVLPAGRVRSENVSDLVRATRCDQVHAGPRVAVADRTLAARPNLAGEMGATTELDVEAVRRLRARLDALVESLS